MTTFYDDINHLLGKSQVIRTPTVKENIECFSRAVNGDDAAIDEFILQNMKLVGGIITKFIQRVPRAQYLVDDMLGEGLVVLTRGVHRWVNRIRDNRDDYQDDFGTLDTGKTLNILGYLYVAISQNVQECYEKESTVPLSTKTRSRHTPSGSETPTMKVDLPQTCIENQTYDAFKEVFYLEEIYGACRTDEEKQIVDARLAGLTQKEVAKRVGLSPPTIRRREKALYTRFCKQQGLTE